MSNRTTAIVLASGLSLLAVVQFVPLPFGSQDEASAAPYTSSVSSDTSEPAKAEDGDEAKSKDKAEAWSETKPKADQPVWSEPAQSTADKGAADKPAWSEISTEPEKASDEAATPEAGKPSASKTAGAAKDDDEPEAAPSRQTSRRTARASRSERPAPKRHRFVTHRAAWGFVGCH